MKTREELLEYAIKNYPIGTLYHPAGYGPEDEKLIKKVVHKPRLFQNSDCIDAGWGYIYRKGQWAKIVVNELDEARKIIYAD